MMLVVDAGNSRIKWGLRAGDRWLDQGTLLHGELPLLAAVLASRAKPDRVVVSNVAGPAVDSGLQDLFAAHGIAATWVTAQAAGHGVVNGYAAPQQLGSDRWAALVAARRRKHCPCVVACAGTALTVDALSASGKFLGGLILPGFTLMQAALAHAAAGLAAAGPAMYAEYPADTASAMHSGALEAMAGAIGRMTARLAAREGQAPAVLLSGGDAALLQGRLPAGSEIVDNLVLEGLVLLAEETGS